MPYIWGPNWIDSLHLKSNSELDCLCPLSIQALVSYSDSIQILNWGTLAMGRARLSYPPLVPTVVNVLSGILHLISVLFILMRVETAVHSQDWRWSIEYHLCIGMQRLKLTLKYQQWCDTEPLCSWKGCHDFYSWGDGRWRDWSTWIPCAIVTYTYGIYLLIWYITIVQNLTFLLHLLFQSTSQTTPRSLTRCWNVQLFAWAATAQLRKESKMNNISTWNCREN